MRSQFDFGEQKTVFGENSVASQNPDGKNTYENFKLNKPFSQTPIKQMSVSVITAKSLVIINEKNSDN